MSTSCFFLGCDKWEEEKEGRLFLRLRVVGWGVVVERRRSTVNLPKRSVCDSEFRVGENGRFRVPIPTALTYSFMSLQGKEK